MNRWIVSRPPTPSEYPAGAWRTRGERGITYVWHAVDDRACLLATERMLAAGRIELTVHNPEGI